MNSGQPKFLVDIECKIGLVSRFEEVIGMANYPKWYASMTLRDYANRPSVVNVRVPEATAKLYFAAADKAARDATAIGLLFAGLLTVTEMVEESRSCYVQDETAPVVLPATGVVRGNKAVLLGETGAEGYRLSIPGRKAASYTLKTNSIEIDIEADGDFKDFIALLETAALGVGGLAVAITEAILND
jgi:hypothetical protein